MSTWVNNGRTIGFSSEGSGVPILAFHGTTQSANAWAQVQQACSANLQWTTFEFPGSGESEMPKGPIDLDVVVADAVALMNHLGHQRFHVIGYSLGAVAALHCAAKFSDAVITVTSLCGWSQTDARMKVTFDLWRRLIAIDRELFMRYALADVQPGSDAQLELDIRVDIEQSLGRITAPCLVIGGIEDRWVDISKSRHIAATVPGATLVELPAGHLVIGELPAEIASAVSAHVA
jgi:pimeloyl-ACP methyl ester carboxylesterase